ncbi:MAG: HEAT repeat domain-containing protein [Anaerolineae bacterium]|nr:HEAT repeat domain-containing protein [Anaerolineae bacterium]MDW8067333.1 HEAT repeat domain-containing protein [Anaerolineae bacterium]
MGWQLDIYSALVGAGFTLLLMGLGYLLRDPFLRGWQELKRIALRTFSQMTAGWEARYRERLIRWAQSAHALADLGPLEQYFVPVRLFLPLAFPDPEQDRSSAPPPLLPADALRGHPRILIVGSPASGRTTLLAHLALTHARQENGASSDPSLRRLPLYVYLPALDWAPASEGKKSPTPLQQLVQGALQTIGAPGSAATPLRQALQAGGALVLADGWDELPPAAQAPATAWLAELADAFPGNIWVVAVGAQQYAPLIHAGFIPLRICPWDRPEVQDFLTRLPTPEHFPLDQATENLTRIWKQTESLLDVALAAGWLLEHGTLPPKRVAPFRQRLEKWAEGMPDFSADLEWAGGMSPLDILYALAWKLQEEGRFVCSRQELEAFIRQQLLSAFPLAEASAGENETLVEPISEERGLPPHTASEGEASAAAPVSEEGPSPPEEPPSERPRLPEPKRVRLAVAARVKAFLGPGGPLVACAPDQYRFAHPLWQAMLTAEALALAPDQLVTHLDDPSWLPVADFYAEIGGMEPVVRAWLSRPDDLWQSRLRRAARWAALAPPDAPWRNGVMALLGRSLLSPDLSDESRQRLAEALIWTGDPGVPLFLRHALRSPNPTVRAIAARMMAVLREKADLSAIVKALEDPHEAVRIAAVQALGEIGIPAAVEWLVRVLESGDETLQVEAARALARQGEEGYRTLREALQSEDFMIRRAAAYGLGEMDAIWARELLARAAREDPQWIVRSAAATVLSEREEKATPVPPPSPPVPSSMGWLITWAAQQGEGVGLGEAAFGPLLRALAEGPAPIRRAAAQTLGWVGRPEHVDALRRALNDPEPEVAQAAFGSLRELSARHGLAVTAEPERIGSQAESPP